MKAANYIYDKGICSQKSLVEISVSCYKYHIWLENMPFMTLENTIQKGFVIYDENSIFEYNEYCIFMPCMVFLLSNTKQSIFEC